MVPQLLRAHKVFKRCALWNLVLLVDEADAFLEARSKDNLDRNELVSSTFKRIIMLSPLNILFSISSTTGISYRRSIDSDYKIVFQLSMLPSNPALTYASLTNVLDRTLLFTSLTLLRRDLSLLLALILVCQCPVWPFQSARPDASRHVPSLSSPPLSFRAARF
jgi:hypothetical protein